MRPGLLVMSYGSPVDTGAVEAYYTHIRRGRAPSDEQLSDLIGRYDAIGGTSALAERTADQVRAIADALLGGDDEKWLVESGTKHSVPSIEDAVSRLIASGADVIVGLVLAPHFSDASVGEYHRRALEALSGSEPGEPDARYRAVESWHMLDELLDFQASQIRRALGKMPADTKVAFTAHSLPERVLQGDPYADQLEESAAAVAKRAGLNTPDGWMIGWQSAGATPEPWRGPDLVATIEDLAGSERCDAVLVVPQGFTSDHLEVRYDIDIEAAGAAARAGIELARTAVVNDDAGVMGALARLVIRTASDSC